MECREILGNDLANFTDLELAQRVREKDADAFLELTRRYLGLIRAKAAPFHISAMDADDLCQEGLMGLLSAALTYQQGKMASFRTYAGVCIANCIITAYRTAASKKNLPLNDFVSLSGDDAELRFVSENNSDPESLLIDQENLQLARSRIEQTLSKMERQVLSLYLGGCSYREIGQKLGITEKAVDNAIQRIRRKLKDHFRSNNMP